MGQIYSYLSDPSPKKLCDDLIDDIDFAIHITVHNLGKTPNYVSLLEYLQNTNPVLSYTYCKSIYLLYSPSRKFPFLRSNVSGDIISALAADVARYCLLNHICDPYFVEVDIIAEPHDAAKKKLAQLAIDHGCYGKLHGLDSLSEEKIKEQFS